MSDRLLDIPAPVMRDGVLRRRRDHLLAELERPGARRLHPVAIVLTALVLCGLAFAPVGGASIAHRVATGLGDLWSSPAPPPKNPADAQNLANDVTNTPPGVTNQDGTPLAGKARDLLSGLGTTGDTITAFPTTNGTVCYELQGAGSCANLEKWPWNTVGLTFSIFSSGDGGTRIFGIAADKVASVGVVVAGVQHAATLQNNAFYYQLPAGVSESDIDQVVATWVDGSAHTFPVSSHPSPPGG